MRDGPDPYRGRVLAKIPSYEASFKTFALHVELPAPLSKDDAVRGGARRGGDARRDPRGSRLHDARRARRAGRRRRLRGLDVDGRRARMGDFLPPDGGASSNGARPPRRPQGRRCASCATARSRRKRPPPTPLHHRHHSSVARPVGLKRRASACRLEAGWNDGDRRVTWLITNPIYLRGGDPCRRPATAAHAHSSSRAAPIPAMPERGRSSAIRSRRRRGARFRRRRAAQRAAGAGFTYQLRRGERASQFAALVTQHVPSIDKATHLSFTGERGTSR